MHLLDSTSYELGEFSSKIPEYAILSHTWEEKEATFQGIQGGNAKDMPGFAKIQGCCAQAKRDGFKYVWIDTCCIDKASSAELSEAINSMYQWYEEAQVCYAYLADVPSGGDSQRRDLAFANSRWFTRGWTLQELIAPPSLVFYGNDWGEIGTKLSLQALVAKTTSIPVAVLKFGNIESFSVAQRMSWASKRQTKRVEDIAYCLIGLFGVNMPMLYGEGERAFRRLQEEIMKTSDDHTLFAWTEPKGGPRWITRGVLARSPAEFVDSGDISRSDPILKSTPYSMTNMGLRIELPLVPAGGQGYCAILNCHRTNKDDERLGIYLKELSSSNGETFARMFPDLSDAVEKEKVRNFEQRTVCILHKNEEDRGLQEQDSPRPFRMSVDAMILGARDGYDISIYSSAKGCKDLGDKCFRFVGRRTGILGVLMFKNHKIEDFVVVLGRYQGSPWCDVVTDDKNCSLVRTWGTYMNASHEDRLDRVSKSLKDGMVSVAIRKQGREQRPAEGEYDGEYAVHVSAHVSPRS